MYRVSDTCSGSSGIVGATEEVGLSSDMIPCIALDATSAISQSARLLTRIYWVIYSLVLLRSHVQSYIIHPYVNDNLFSWLEGR
jgi:hypothetical protein